MKAIRLIIILLFLPAWQPMQSQWVQTNGPAGSSVYSLARYDSILLAGTDHGVFRSTNNGGDWFGANTGVPAGVGVVACFAVFGPHLFAGTVGVLLSTDAGASWTTKNSGLPGGIIHAFAMKDSILFAATDDGIYLSANNGSSWTPANNGAMYPHISDLVVSGPNILAGTNAGPGIYLSTDNGAHWTLEPGATDLHFAQSDTDLFAVGDRDVLLSTDHGLNWTVVDSGLTGYGFRSLAVNGRCLFMGTQDGGIFRSTNNGARWTAVTSVGAYVSTLFADGENLLAGTLGGGVLVSPDEGEVWTARNSGVNNSIVVALAARGTDLFAGTSGAGAFRSTDAGKHWTSINAGLTNSNVLHLAVSGTNLVAGTPGGVFVSDDNGANWKSANVGLTNPYIDVLAVSDSNLIVVTSDNKVSFYANGGGSWTSPACVGLHGHIFCVAMSGTDMFVGTAGEGLLYRSTDQGASWTAANTGLACGNVYAIFKNRADLLAGTDKGVFLSTNCGSTWTSSGIVLSENSYLQTFAAHESALFAGSYYDGVFLSTNDGASWSAVGSGLPTTNIMSLAVCGRDLFAGTHGSGAWRRPLSEFSIPFQTEPVAYYPFDGNANDESEKGHDGIISGALLAAGRFGKPNSCYYFINQNYISVPHDSVFNLLGDMTISAWYKTDSSSANPMTLIAKRSGNSPFWEMAIQYPSKQMGFIFSDNSSNTVYHLSRGVVSSKTWQHVVVVVKHDSSFIWLDGAQDSGESLAIARSTNESPVTIGNAMAGSRECFVGWIDDIRIFNGALADSEIFYLFHEGGWGLPPGAPQLVSPLNGDGLSSSVISFLWNKAVSPAHPVTGYLFDLGIDSSFTSHTIDSTLTDTLKVVKDLLNGQKYWWRVKARSTVGWGSFGEKRKFKVAIAGVENAKELPKQFALGQNYPNPFNPGTKIEYALPRSSHVSLKVFNNLGQEVATLVNERQAAGFYNVRFNGTNIGSGVYFYRIQAGDFVATKKLLLIK